MDETTPKKRRRRRRRRGGGGGATGGLTTAIPKADRLPLDQVLAGWWKPAKLSRAGAAERVLTERLHEALVRSSDDPARNRCQVMGQRAQKFARTFLLAGQGDDSGTEPTLTRFRSTLCAYAYNPEHPLSREVAEKYTQTLLGIARLQLSDFKGRGVAESFLGMEEFPTDELLEHTLYALYQRDFVPRFIQAPLAQLIETDPKEEYPAARLMRRKFVIHVGGTNTGKTYQSLQQLAQAETGVYLAPLRLLACEVQDTLQAKGVACSLLTGEEEDIVPFGTHIASTVEKLNLYERYDLCVIDECQMIADRQRGFAWTRAILGCQAEEIHLCTAPEALDICVKLIESCGDPYEIHRHQRTTKLEYVEEPISLSETQPGDALIAFSKKNVLEFADKMNANGHPTSIIYGALPYPARKMQMERFLKHETELLVATDAIGMGLNLPIRRVIFTTDKKFDGISSRPLQAAEVKQIAGRAGRMGMYDIGLAGSLTGSEVIREGLETEVPPIEKAMLGFSDLVLRVDHDLLEVLKVWNAMPTIEPYQKMDIESYIWIIEKIQERGIELSKGQYLTAASIPFEESSEELLELFLSYCAAFSRGDMKIDPPKKPYDSLDALELYCKALDLYYSFSHAFGYEMEDIRQEKLATAARINEILITQIRKKGNSCRKCHRSLAWDYPYRICNACRRGLNHRHR